ncbi:hypothetical protein PIB30_105852, partial [Stylosanthes scabra]|nr:hypothetical protein [Stylosanthes scabra]
IIPEPILLSLLVTLSEQPSSPTCQPSSTYHSPPSSIAAPLYPSHITVRLSHSSLYPSDSLFMSCPFSPHSHALFSRPLKWNGCGKPAAVSRQRSSIRRRAVENKETHWWRHEGDEKEPKSNY